MVLADNLHKFVSTSFYKLLTPLNFGLNFYCTSVQTSLREYCRFNQKQQLQNHLDNGGNWARTCSVLRQAECQKLGA